VAQDLVIASRPIGPTEDQSCSTIIDDSKKQKGARTSRPVLSSILGKNQKLSGKTGAKPADAKLAAAEPAYRSKAEPNLYSGAALIYTGLCGSFSCCCATATADARTAVLCVSPMSLCCVLCLSPHPCALNNRLARQWLCSTTN
jgi:hypothetical protein